MNEQAKGYDPKADPLKGMNEQQKIDGVLGLLASRGES